MKYVKNDWFWREPVLRRRAVMFASRLLPTQMPTMMSALSGAAAPVEEHLEKFAVTSQELRQYELDGTAGQNMQTMAHIHGVSVEVLVRERAEYLGFEEVGSPAGSIALALFCSYRCTQRAVADRHAYYVSSEAAALVFAGCVSAADVSATVADLPSPSGIAYFDRPDEDGLYLLWHVIGDLLWVQMVSGVGVAAFLAHDGFFQGGVSGWKHFNSCYLPLPFVEAEMSALCSDVAPTRLERSGAFDPQLDGTENERMKAVFGGWDPDRALMLLLSLTHMLRQDKLIDAESVGGRGGSSKAGSRRRFDGAITYLSYRPRRSAGASSASSDRHYSHRWLVRGHWRRQWYPSQKRHIPIWITEYVAGPDDAPIRVSDKVTLI